MDIWTTRRPRSRAAFVAGGALGPALPHHAPQPAGRCLVRASHGSAKGDTSREEDTEEQRALLARSRRLDAEFRALQNESSHIPNLHMYNVDEYEVDPRGLPWLQELRGRDRAKLYEALGKRPVPEGFDSVPLSYTDLFDDSELNEMQDSFTRVDPRGNREWMDPMPASDFDVAAAWAAGLSDGVDVSDTANSDSPTGDGQQTPLDAPISAEDSIHFREFPALDDGDERDLLDLEQNARKSVPYASLEEEREALLGTYYENDFRAMVENEAEVSKWCQGDISRPAPDPEVFKKWQQAAVSRGGNVSMGDSSYLSPVKLASNVDIARERRLESGAHKMSVSESVPGQRATLVDAHSGQWTAIASVFSIDANTCSVEEVAAAEATGTGGSDGNTSAGGSGEISEENDDNDPRRMGKASGDLLSELQNARPRKTVTLISSLEEGAESENLSWKVRLSSATGAPEDFATASVPCAEALAPGLAVFTDGSFVAEASDVPLEADSSDEGVGECVRSASGLTLSDDFLSSLVGGSAAEEAVRGVAELCLVVGEDGSRRQRVILCVVDDRLAYVVSLSEVRGVGGDAEARATMFSSLRTCIDETLLGIWRGEGTSLHPHFPPFPTSRMTSLSEFERLQQPPAPQDLTYLKEDISSAASATSRRAPRSLGREDGEGGRTKLSKRVVSALRHDANRLARCRLVGTDILQEAAKERHAWEVLPYALRSPRLGPYAPEYVTLALPGGVLLSTVLGKWDVRTRNRVELTSVRRHEKEPARTVSGPGRERSRLVAARSIEGVVTGACLLVEIAVEATDE